MPRPAVSQMAVTPTGACSDRAKRATQSNSRGAKQLAAPSTHQAVRCGGWGVEGGLTAPRQPAGPSPGAGR